ncbi:hypothetical protein [Spirillospora sp. CA-294931]|uniref:hypothetical protein n=1 Tax=Spirillospora sp. CA-294931 TaxID=3240042 RepID=UPI003D8D03A7
MKRLSLPLAVAVVGGLAVSAAVVANDDEAGAVPAAATAPSTPSMPAPTGPEKVGKIDLHLVDKDRDEPWPAQAKPGKRELMVSVYYPAAATAGHKRAPYMTSAIAKTADQFITRGEFGLASGAVNWTGILTNAHLGAPMERGKHPVLVYSTEHLRMRNYGTAQAEDLASHGYIVVTTESTHEAFGVEFPGGRVEPIRLAPGSPNPPDAKKMTKVRVDDLRFVIDRLADLDAGRNPDHGKRALPAGTRGAFDLRRTGVYGHVGGSVPGLELTRTDRRVKAVAGLTDLVGTEKDDWSPIVHTGVKKPYMLLSTTELNADDEIGNRVADAGWRAFWPKLTGWKLNVQLQSSRWHALGDYIWLTHRVPGIERRDALVGTVRPDRALRSQNAFLNAFFDRHLRGRDDRVLHRASPAHPDITYLP